MKEHPAAFISYVHFDDEHDNGRPTEICQRLGHEVHIQTGDTFELFLDRDNIKWGQQWRKRIEESLGEVTFFIPVITPDFFKSRECRKELEKFLAYEKRLKRDDLVLSIYYIDCPLLSDAERLATDKLAQAIADRHYGPGDLREVRFEPLTSPQIGKAIAEMALQIRDAIERTSAGDETKPKHCRPYKRTSLPKSADAADSEPATETPAETNDTAKEASSSSRAEPPTYIVDPYHHGDFLTISQAIKAAEPGSRILVRPGLYEEGLVIDKPLEIIGDGDREEITVQASGADAIHFSTTMGRVSNLTLRQIGGGNWYGVDVEQGRLDLEDCDVSSESLACVAIRNHADPRIRRNRIHDGKQDGVMVLESGQGILEDNDIFGNALSGVEIRESSNPTLRRNRIHDSSQNGVYVHDNGVGLLEDNDILSSGYSGVEIKSGGNPTLRRNQIHDGKYSGVYVQENGQGIMEDNQIYGNRTAGASVKSGGHPTFRRNQIKGNGYEAVHVVEGGKGTFEDNDLRDNAEGAWDIAADCEANVKRSGNLE